MISLFSLAQVTCSVGGGGVRSSHRKHVCKWRTQRRRCSWSPRLGQAEEIGECAYARSSYSWKLYNHVTYENRRRYLSARWWFYWCLETVYKGTMLHSWLQASLSANARDAIELAKSAIWWKVYITFRAFLMSIHSTLHLRRKQRHKFETEYVREYDPLRMAVETVLRYFTASAWPLL